MRPKPLLQCPSYERNGPAPRAPSNHPPIRPGASSCLLDPPSPLPLLPRPDGLKSSPPAQPGITGPRTSAAGIGWHVHWLRQQKGVMRYNCADSLDRTNVGSFFGAVQVSPSSTFRMPARPPAWRLALALSTLRRGHADPCLLCTLHGTPAYHNIGCTVHQGCTACTAAGKAAVVCWVAGSCKGVPPAASTCSGSLPPSLAFYVKPCNAVWSMLARRRSRH